MSAAYGALCTDFFVNQKLSLKMDLPSEREPLLSFFDRMRKQRGGLASFRRFEGELVLESDPDVTPCEWLALRRTSIRSGVENPTSVAHALSLHRSVLEIAPYFLSISPLDVETLELVFGFDLEVEANRNEIVFEALFGSSPLGGRHANDTAQIASCQPYLAFVLDGDASIEACIEVKTRVSEAELSSGRYQRVPLTVFARVRQASSLASVDELPVLLDGLAEKLVNFVDERVIPAVLTPIRHAIMSPPD